MARSLAVVVLLVPVVAGAAAALEGAQGGADRPAHAPGPPGDSPRAGSPPRVLSRRTAAMREDDGTDRVIAVLAAELVAAEGGARLTVRVSAEAPEIDAAPGFEGVRGSNRITSRELEALFAARRVEVTVGGPGGALSAGRASAGRRGTVWERRLRADGRVEHVPLGGAAGADRLLEGVFEAPLAGVGEFTVEVRVDGDVRARARVRLTASGGEIVGLEALAQHGPAEERS